MCTKHDVYFGDKKHGKKGKGGETQMVFEYFYVQSFMSGEGGPGWMN
jgi:hypothetical protein